MPTILLTKTVTGEMDKQVQAAHKQSSEEKQDFKLTCISTDPIAAESLCPSWERYVPNS